MPGRIGSAAYSTITIVEGEFRDHRGFEGRFKLRLVGDKVRERTIVPVSHPNKDRKFEVRPSLVSEMNIERIIPLR